MAEPRMEVNLHQRLEQRLKLSQQVIQSLELLQLPLLELTQMVTQELLENPTLELKQDVDETPEEPEVEDLPTERPENDKLTILEEIESSFEESYGGRFSRGNSEESDRRFEMLQNVAGKEGSLRDHLMNQLMAMDIPAVLNVIAENIVYNINDDGYLSSTVEEIAATLKEQFPDRTENELIDDVETVLRLIQKLDPPGVGARDTRECLMLQLLPDDPLLAVKRSLIEKYMEDISHNRLPKVAAETGMELEELKNVLAEIAKMNPKPGANFTVEAAPKIYPDVVIKEVDDKYEIALEDSFLPSITINRKYQEMLKRKELSKPEREFIQKRLESGKRLISAIEQRRTTIFRIVDQLVNHQQEFLEKGIEYLQPLKMQEVADTIGVHVSTVSRAISDKYVQTPRGIFSLKFFFASGVPETGIVPDGNGGDTRTRLALMTRIQEMVEGEEKKSPLSDSDIVQKLKDQGLTVARRTVAKYREELNIPSSRLRKQF